MDEMILKIQGVKAWKLFNWLSIVRDEEVAPKGKGSNLYFGGGRFGSRPGLNMFMVFLSSSRKIRG
jgi:hypothetical protein